MYKSLFLLRREASQNIQQLPLLPSWGHYAMVSAVHFTLEDLNWHALILLCRTCEWSVHGVAVAGVTEAHLYKPLLASNDSLCISDAALYDEYGQSAAT